MAEEKKEDDTINSNTPNQFKMSWSHIINCVKHEMYPKLASTIQSIIDRQNSNQSTKTKKLQTELYDINTTSIRKLLNYLKTKRKLPIEEVKYLTNLIKRAQSFTVPTEPNRSYVVNLFKTRRLITKITATI